MDVSHNQIDELPGELAKMLSKLTKLDASYNQLDEVSGDIVNKVVDVDLTNNLLSSVLPAFRKDKNKVFDKTIVT